MTDTQFYPTPMALARHAWSMFKDRSFARVCEPSAGNGDLIKGLWGGEEHPRHRQPQIDCIEIDVARHPLLRSAGLNVVGLDFMTFEGGAIYSHVIMNPPFAVGVQHTLKAFDMLYSGEVVAILNAETVRNPFSVDRKRLVSLIDRFGRVEFHKDSFQGPDVEREADVEVALVHLVKPAELGQDWIGPIISAMATDRPAHPPQELPQELALPASFVETQCAAFRVAVKAMHEAVRAEAVSSRCASRVGVTMAELNRRGSSAQALEQVGDQMRKEIERRYLDLKDRAWASILRSTNTMETLSAKVRRQAEAQFQEISKLEFTEQNVYSLLLGLVESRPEMQVEMACEVFDKVTRYASDNCVFYRGWKSNDRHRTCGKRVKMTRFVIPGNKVHFGRRLDWDAERELADFDKVFAMLDGVPLEEVDISLVQLFRNSGAELLSGQRLSSSYFDVRWYGGVGTIHFFPRRKDLIDRLNRLVGKHRQWLPPNVDDVHPAFWTQFEKAEKFDAEVRKQVEASFQQLRREKSRYVSSWDHPLTKIGSGDLERNREGAAALSDAIDAVLERHGLLAALPSSDCSQPLLLAA